MAIRGLLVFFVLQGVAIAACTSVQDAIANPDATPFVGRIVIDLGTSITTGSVLVAQNAVRLAITNGAIATCLVAGTYRVTYTPSGYPNYIRWWTVPSAGPVTVRAIEIPNAAPLPPFTFRVGTITTLAAGSSPTVVNSGTAANIVLDFGFPTAAAAAALTWDTITQSWDSITLAWDAIH